MTDILNFIKVRGQAESPAVARHFGISERAVCRAIYPALAAGHIIQCDVKRPGQKTVKLYRWSGWAPARGGRVSYTLTETGTVLTETQEGITMPADYSFASVNDYVHGIDVHFEDLLALCLGMANHIDQLGRGEFICRRCGLRKDSERSTDHEF